MRGKTARPKRADHILSKVMPMRSRPFSRAALLRALCLLVVLGMAAGCAGDAEAPPPELPAEELYSQGQAYLAEANFREAAKSFEEVERQHPYSQWATRGQMMAAYAYYESNQYEESVAAAERFIELHPGNKDVPYAYYLMGIATTSRSPMSGATRR